MIEPRFISRHFALWQKENQIEKWSYVMSYGASSLRLEHDSDASIAEKQLT